MFQPSFDDLGTALREVTFVVVDLETTGTRPTDAAITEIGAVKVRGGEVLGEFQSLVNAGRQVPAFITRLTGITTAMLVDAPPITAVLPSFFEWARGCVLVAHNASFDVSFLKAAAREYEYEWPGFPVVDTVPLARRVITRDEVPNHKLSTLAAFFRTQTTPDHRALTDARATVDVLHGILGRLGSMGVTHLEDLASAADPVHPEVRRKRTLADGLPEAPGVYMFRAPDDEVLYVGTSANIRKRVRTYFTAAEKRRQITEMVRIAVRVDPIVCATTLESAVRELRLIAEHTPLYNRKSKYPQKHTWIRLTDEPYPRLSVVREVRPGSLHLGPFASARTVGDAVDALHDALPLRRCTTRLALVSRRAGSSCALAGLGRCSAPCLATDAPDATYADVAERAVAVFCGDPSPVVATLAERIATLAAQERFEEAALVTSRVRAFLAGAARAQQFGPLAECAELVAARPNSRDPNPGGWEIVVVKHGRLAATGITREHDDPVAIVEALRATAETVEAPNPPATAAHPEETSLLLDWLASAGVRLVEVSHPWALPVRSALSVADLTNVANEVKSRLSVSDCQPDSKSYP